ncbi:drug/metabolite transporter, DME family [Streptoalloteichus tenebrarius]|uniref:Drug/metabolite transporter, DME family n=1 Tax=Streptoalloteichus tenebrarius (strain ATCC 17920 / DSM 40477 / JCM 4838 / CBS 697.72 / NBRC 16177 / NCIMB 11028 / NRRL B-12390 / A12253. 1 / ISP 5477) TaxID=1933 RepID=A0ABT1HW35_STRSD|nr:EamA family transporter [Streptoalloteichus tenebrarius]MCP2259736.1 drug/metabolite transporter, DME family [Streptoalloteichus tenebrarius]
MSGTPTAARAALLVLVASVLFGTTGTAQALGPGGLDPLVVGATRVVLAGAVLVALAWARGAFRAAPRVDWRTLVAGAVGVGLYQVGFFTGVRLAGVAVGTVVALGSCPIWAGLVAWVVTRRAPGRMWAVATALAVAGVVTLVLAGAPAGGGDGVLLGCAPALAAGLGYGMYTVAGSRMIAAGQRSDGAMGLMFGAGAVLLVPVLVLRWPGGLESGAGWLTVGYLALVPTVLAYLLFGAGLRVLPAPTVATLNLAEPVIAAALGVAVLGEPVTAGGVVGALLVLAGLGVLALPAPGRRAEKEPVSAG